MAPTGEININGKKVDRLEARQTSTNNTQTQFKQSGLTVSISNPVIGAIQTAQNMGDALKNVDDARFKVLAAANRAIEAKGAYSAVKVGQGHIATNGIFNDKEHAKKYADQHTTSDGKQYAVVFSEADNIVSELLVAGYQKYLEGDILGLTNATQEIKEEMNQYGQTGLELDGHSRGSMTIGNALESKIKEDNAQGSLSDTTITFFGPAYNAKKADDLLSVLQNRTAMDSATQASEVLKLQNHIADPIGVLIGGNPATGGSIPEGSSMLQEMLRAATGQDVTSHNCYGKSHDLTCQNFWKDSLTQHPISQPAVIIKPH
jgi:filamentous hemagglutinin